jgi:hypothetical protein
VARGAVSPRPVHVTPMLHAVNQNDVVLVDLVHDPVVPPPGRPQTGELADERLADPVRTLSQRADHERDGGVTNLRREAIEVPNALWGDVDLVQASAGEMITQPDTFAAPRLSSRPFDRGDKVGVAHDVERLLQ